MTHKKGNDETTSLFGGRNTGKCYNSSSGSVVWFWTWTFQDGGK